MKRFFVALLVLVGFGVVFHSAPAAALSSDPKMFISADNVFYAYVKAGETVSAAFDRVNQDEIFATSREDITVTLDGPDMTQQKCVIAKDVAVGQGCHIAPQTAQKSGIWRINFDVPSEAKAYPQVSPDVHWGKNLFNWNITVKSGNDEQHGRLWSGQYAIRQPAPVSYLADFTYYYISQDGYIYRAIYKGFNGQISTLSADAVGVRKGTDCLSAYKSVDVDNTDGYSQALGSCGSAYKLFFEEPAGDLPTAAATWDGKTDWVRPNVSRPSLSKLQFTADDSNDQQSGTISFSLQNFIGQYDVKVDTDNDGSFDGQNDVTLHQQMKGLSDGTQKIQFNGTDRAGQIIPRSQKIGIEVIITKVAEIHLVAADVEGLTGGLALTRVSGDNAPTTGLCWNDTELTPLDPNKTTAVLDGRNCPDSTGGVHGWSYFDDSWGNNRYIDNWVYASAKLTGDNRIVYPSDTAVAVATKGPNIALIIAVAVILVVAGGGIGAVLITRARKKAQLRQQQALAAQVTPTIGGYQQPIQPSPTNTYDDTPPTQPPQA